MPVRVTTRLCRRLASRLTLLPARRLLMKLAASLLVGAIILPLAALIFFQLMHLAALAPKAPTVMATVASTVPSWLLLCHPLPSRIARYRMGASMHEEVRL